MNMNKGPWQWQTLEMATPIPQNNPTYQLHLPGLKQEPVQTEKSIVVTVSLSWSVQVILLLLCIISFLECTVCTYIIWRLLL